MSLIARFLRRMAAPTPPRFPARHPDAFPDSAETWAPGDLAECIDRGVWRVNETGEPGAGPASGERHVVRLVIVVAGRQFLHFARWPGRCHDAVSFRKIQPRADAAEPGDAAWLRALLATREPA